MSLDAKIHLITGKVWGLLVKEARKVCKDNADMQRAFMEECIARLQNDLRNM